jgi:hypothetical protein
MNIQKTFNILSIDFDFFQDVSKGTMSRYYPDSIDLGTEISKFVWAGYYANPNSSKHLEKVGILYKEYNTLKEILMNNTSKNIPILIANSHFNIYKFIHENYDKAKNKDKKINLINIDMHHDMFNNNKNLDCGNWLNYIIKEYGKNNENHETNNNKLNVQWIANPISYDCYNLNEEIENIILNQEEQKEQEPKEKKSKELKNIKRYKKLTALEQLENLNQKIIKDNYKFDLIFLCRSDTWLPPHLDKYFEEIVSLMVCEYTNVVAENHVLYCRDIDEIVKKEKEIYKDNYKK